MPSKPLANRPAVDSLVTNTWDTFVNAVEDLPAYAQRNGIRAAVTYGQTHLRVLVELLGYQWGRTKEAVRRSHLIQMFLGEGEIRAMCHDSDGGAVIRQWFMSAVAANEVGPSIKTAFERGREDDEGAPYEPETGER